MYRLLIVDDEAIIADGLFEVFQNESQLDLDVYKAYSGRAALQLLNENRIDIVLTDIQMPDIDGMQLLDKIRESWPQCRVIFLTGYNKFDYVYSAIQYEGVSYLLKTEGYAKVIQAVAHAVADIEQEFKAEELLLKAKKQLDATAEWLQRDYFNGIFKGTAHVREINGPQFAELGIPLAAKMPVLMLLGRLDELPERFSYADRARWLYGIRLIAERYFAPHAVSVHFVDDAMTLIWLIQPDGGGEGNVEDPIELWRRTLIYIKGNLEWVQNACKEAVGVSLSLALDDSPVPWHEAPERFSILKMLLNYRIGQGSGMLVTDKSIVEKGLQQSVVGGREKLNVRQFKLEQLADALEHGRKEEVNATLDAMAGQLAPLKSIYLIPAQEIYYATALIYLSYINRWNLAEKMALDIGLHKLMRIEEHGSWADAIRFLRRLTASLFEIQDSEQEKRALDAAGRIQKHIADNLHDELSLVRLADLVYFNPSYLSRLFKQVTGINLSDYICEARVKKAKQLLENANTKVQEIAAAVGYSSPANFARFFKKMTRLTPQEYRDSCLNK
ncbi:response regulator [Cohnella sp. GCM10020058]|uniref:response regulator transcription factor n=1 Tax=Cohnella sp. GCM10020058 TaxID=3317330 RepID=UPI0036351AB4